MRGNSQNGGQTTKSLLIKPQCSGVPIQQAVSLSSSFPRHCLLFVCAFFREMQESAGRKNPPAARSPVHKNRPGFHHGNRGGSFALWVLFSGARAKPCEGSFGKPRVCGEKEQWLRTGEGEMGSPSRMYAGKRLKRSRSTVSPVAIVPLFPSVCNKPVVSNGNPAGRDAPLFLPAENAAAAPAGPAGSCPASRPSQFPPRITVISPRP